MTRSTHTLSAFVKLTIFTVTSMVVTGVLAMIIGNLGFGKTTSYHAVFSSASQMESGDDVRIGGVIVGRVENVEILEQDKALVDFSVKQDVPLTSSTHAEIRYLNLIGDRYLALTRGKAAGAPLDDGDTIPMKLTSPALDLTELFNGFQPLFAALEPEDVNQLSMQIVQTLQGEGGTVESLLSHTASLTTSLAERDQLIGDVVDNLNTMLATVDNRHRQLSELVIQLRRWVGGLARDRKAIGASLRHINALAVSTADLLQQGRPLIREDVQQLRQVLDTLTEPGNKRLLQRVIRVLPEKLSDQTRTGTYGSWYNYYLCDFEGRIILPDLPGNIDDLLQPQLASILMHSDAERCEP